MSKKIIMLTIFMMVTCSSTFAVTRNWDDGGGDHLWDTAANWSSDTEPTASDDVGIGADGTGPTIEAGVAAVCNINRVGGTNTTETITMTGGTYTGDSHLILGESGGSTATLNISDGTLTAASLWAGNNGAGIVNMTGGTITLTAAAEKLYISRFSENGTFNLDGGTVNAKGIYMSAGALDLDGGTLIIDGDVNSTIASYVSSSYITANNGGGTVLHDYNITNASKTTVTASGGGGSPPSKATTPTPADAATGVDVNDALFWAAVVDANNYNVYFGTSSPGSLIGNQEPNTYDPAGAMDANTLYYWRIDPNNEYGTTTGDVWSFTTAAGPPDKATNPSPANAATDVTIKTDLSWTAAGGAANYDLYFGTSSPGSLIGNQAGTTYDTGTMDSNTVYYWRIDPNGTGGKTTGDVWSFTTMALLAPSWECGSFKLEFNPTTGVVSSIYKKDDTEELMTGGGNNGFCVKNLVGDDVQLVDVNQTAAGRLYAASADANYSVTFDVNSSADANYMTFSIYELVGLPTSGDAKLYFNITPDFQRDWEKGKAVICWKGEGDAFGLMPLDYMVKPTGGSQMSLDWHYLWRRGDDANSPLGDFAIFVCDQNDALDVIDDISVDQGLPYPLYHGEWGKRANWVANQSFLSLGFSNETDKAKAVNYCKDSGLGMMYLAQTTWEGPSVNTINTTNFSTGAASLLAFSRELRQDNILLGIHSAAANLRQSDTSYVAGTPDSRLASWGSGTLASGINDSATTISMTPDAGTVEPTISSEVLGVRPPTYTSQLGYHYIQIGNEIIQVGSYSTGSSPWSLTSCTRGAQGTTAASHSSSDPIKGMVTVYNTMMVDPDNSIFQEVADKLSGVANDCEISFISFDSLDSADAKGAWAREKFMLDTFEGFDNYVSADTSSGLIPYQWYIASMSNCGEPMHTYPQDYFEDYLLDNATYNFVPEGLGCYTLRTDSRNGAWHATSPDEFEWWMSKCAAYDAIYFFETSVAELDAHGQTATILANVKKWEAARLNEVFSDAQKADMEDFDMSFRLINTDANSTTWTAAPLKITPAFIDPDGSADVNNVHTAQAMRFEVQVLPSYDYSSGSNTSLLPADTCDLTIDNGLSIVKDGNEWTFSMTNSGGSISSALQGNDPISETDFSSKRGIGLYFTGDGNGGYFFVEYKDDSWKYRQYFVANDSNSQVYVEIPSTEVCDYLYRDDFHWLVQQNYGSIRQGFDFTKIGTVSFGLIGVPATTSVSVVVEGIKALAETAVSMDDLTMTADGTTLIVDGNVASGNYIVYDGGGSTATVLDPNRSFVANLDVNDTGWQKDANESSVTVSCSGATKPWLKVLFKTMGSTFSFSNPNFKATNPSPVYGATNVDPNNVVLSWEASIFAADVNGHDVYLGTSYSAVADADRDANEYVGVFDTNTHTLVSDLDANTTYYWAVDEVNGVDVYYGDIWMFKTFTVPGQATSPSPADGATSQSRGVDLGWAADDSATSHDVYLGTVSADVNDANTNDSEFKVNQAGVTYDPGTLTGTTTYYWRIDEKNGVGTAKGDVWSFTTGAAPSSLAWDNGGSGTLWSTSGNWNPDDIPGSTTDISIYVDGTGPTIDATVTDAAVNIIRAGGTNMDDNMTVTGGTLTTSSHFILGESSGSTATLTMSGGTINAYTLWAGNSGDGYIDMTGGTINISNESLYIARFGTGDGNIQFDGGTITAPAVYIAAGGLLDFEGGTLILDGDDTATIASYVSSGYITAYDGAGTVDYDYNTTNAGKTTVTGSE